MLKKGFSTILIVIIALVVIMCGVLVWQYRLAWVCPAEFTYSGTQCVNCHLNPIYPVQTDRETVLISGKVEVEQGTKTAPYLAAIVDGLYLFDINTGVLLQQSWDYGFETMVGKNITVKGYIGKGDIISTMWWEDVENREEYIVKTVDALYITEIKGWRSICCDNLPCHWFSIKNFDNQIKVSNQNLKPDLEQQIEQPSAIDKTADWQDIYTIVSKKDIPLPQGYTEETWEGDLIKCTPLEEPMPWECGSCYSYVLVLNNDTQMLFNDEDFEDLEELVGSRVRLVGYDRGAALISCPKQFVISKIIIK